MKKLLLSLATVLCMGSFASAETATVTFGSNVTWTGQGTSSVKATTSAEGFDFALEVGTNTSNKVVDACFQSNHIRAYKGFDLTISSADNKQITEIVLTAASNKVGDMTIGGTSYSWSKVAKDGTLTWTGDATSITINATGAQCQIASVAITYVSAGGVVVEVPTFSVAGGTYDKAQTVELSAAADCTIYYTTDGQNPTDDVDDGSTIKYTAPINVDKTMTIKAIAVDADDNMSNVVSETYTIVETIPGAEGDGTEANPYNAIAAYNAALLGSTAEVYVKGIVSSIVEVSTQYGNATYYISADGKEDNQFYIFRGLNLGGEKFTAEDQLKVGDKVVVLGNLMIFSGSGIPQLAQGNKIVTLNGEEPEPIVLEGEGTEAKPYTVADVIAINPTNSSANEDYPDKYWVKGYIVGYSDGTSSALAPVFNADEANSQTNILIAADPDCTDIALCVPVQLPSGKVREALNLKDHADILHQSVEVYGNIYKYFNVPGVKNTSDYKLASDGIAAVAIDENAPVEYFNLQGVRVENPSNGLYIMRQGDKVVKVIK